MKIGILGYGGTIAGYATENLLKKGFTVIGGQRHKKDDFDGYAGFSYMKTDVSDPESLKDFCNACDVVVNCTSPSSVYGVTVASAAAEAGKMFVDPTDLSEFNTDNYPDIGFLFSCGYMPGFSEYLVKNLWENYFSEPDTVVMYQGGSDICSPSAFADIILSADSAGKGDSRIRDGKRVPAAVNISEKFSLPFFEQPVILKSYLSNDFVKVCEQHHIKNACCLNVYPDMEIMNLYFRGMVAAMDYPDDGIMALDAIVSEVGEDIKRMQENPDKENVLCVEMSGISDGEHKAFRAVVRTRNNSEISGWFLAESVEKMIKSEKFTGRKYGFELADKELWEKAVETLNNDHCFTVTEIDSLSFNF